MIVKSVTWAQLDVKSGADLILHRLLSDAGIPVVIDHRVGVIPSSGRLCRFDDVHNGALVFTWLTTEEAAKLDAERGITPQAHIADVEARTSRRADREPLTERRPSQSRHDSGRR